MYYYSELGVVVYWCYKESGHSEELNLVDDVYNDKISWLRQLFFWCDEIVDSSEWIEYFKQAEFDDIVYVMMS